MLSTELIVLLAGTALGLVHIGLQSMAMTKVRGVEFNMSPRDDQQPLPGIAGRLERASNNFKETFPYFAVVVFVGALTSTFSSVTAAAAVAWLVARIIYLPLYAFGIPGLRSIVWIISLVSIIVFGGALLV